MPAMCCCTTRWSPATCSRMRRSVNVVSIFLPPLRERPGDIPELVEHFLATRQVGPLRSRIEAEALKALTAYSWPGKVRELANVLERAHFLAENHVITVDDLPE